MQKSCKPAGRSLPHAGTSSPVLAALRRKALGYQTLASFDAAGHILTTPDLLPPASSNRIPAQGNGRRMQKLRAELLAAWSEVIDEGAASGTYTLGKAVQQFERIVEDAWTTSDTDPLHAVMVNSGTTAIYGALVACGIKSGDYVIVPAMTFVSTALACSWVGATPIFVDIAPGTWTLSIDAVKRLLAERDDLLPNITAIMPVHLYSAIMPDMAQLLDLAQAEGWKVIEDASQAHGATLTVNGERYFAGTMSDAGCFSMSGVKNAGVAEDGGCILTRSPEMAAFLRMWRDLGRKPGDRYGFHIPGVRGRMGAFAAACGIVQFRYLNEWNQRRREIATRYTAAFNEAGLPLITQVVPEESEPSYYKYVVVTGSQAERERIEDCLAEANIETEHYYPAILPDQPVYRSGQLLCVVAGDLTVARHLASCGTCLPIYPELNWHEQERVIEAVKQAFARRLNAGVAVTKETEQV
jgi:dTDP-4-amino-4,6-dideoxygalactose transaminase